MKNFLLIISLFFCSILSAQVYVKPFAFSWGPNSCTNSVSCEVYGLQGQDYAVFTDPLNNVIQNIGHLDTIHDVCFFDNSLNTSDFFSYVATNGYLSYMLTHSSIITSKFNYFISDYTEPSAADSSDGAFTIYFDSLITSFYIQITQGSYIPSVTIFDDNTLLIDSVHHGNIQFYIENPSDSSEYAYFQIHIGDPADIPPVDTLEVGVSYQHASSDCSGWISIQPEVLSANYYNVWSDGPYNTFTRTDLCPGVYSVYTYAQDNITAASIAGHADTIIITNDDYTYIDTNLFSIIPQDTSYYQFENCAFDYYEAIDSIVYLEDTVFNSGGLLIVTFDMNIYQGNNFINVHDSIIMVGDSLVLLDVVIYCNTFKSEFKGQRILFLRGADNHYFVSPLGNEENEPLSKISIYPNPVNDELMVELPNEKGYSYEIYDQNGRICARSESIEPSVLMRIDTKNLENGVYLLTIVGDDILEHKRFVKIAQ